MDLIKIEKKWQKIWEEKNLYKFDKNNKGKKWYVLEMFSYPSAAKLHIGHWYNYGPTDSYARFKRMKGFNVFQPMGFDAFGLPAENYAIKTGIHPKDSTLKNIETMKVQLKAMGAMFDWSAEIETCLPEYYKWTQWMFLKLYEKGLAYRKEAPVNWCPSCNTVLANEQVKEGLCERCSSQILHKNLTQWFFKITDYAEELLEGLDKIDWPEKTKIMQRNWIGKSTGGEIEFRSESGASFRVFTTRADTLFGVSYVVLAPEHPLVEKLTMPQMKAAVEEYILQSSKANEIERLSSTREKTGVFLGSYVFNPINGEKVPVYIADYVLASYGTGAVMGVPAHDERDYVFAQKYNLPVKRVIKGIAGNDDLPFTDNGILINSGEFDGLPSEKAKDAILEKLKSVGAGEKKVNYRLRDWLVSRQRYWGAPIPIIHCPDCGEIAVPEKDLPVLLPYNVEFAPDGKSPLAKSAEFMNTVCPRCGKPALRDPDTLDTFVCSSWYYLRYPDSKNSEKPFDTDIINKMLPVDKYVGGSEHACMHLLYARFFTKALRDMGYLNFDEPFASLVHQGIILGPDGNRMSKSKGNVVSPDEYIKKYGADIFRLYLMFGFSYTEGGPWNDDGIRAVARFVDRVEKIVTKAYGESGGKASRENEKQPDWGENEKQLNFVRHNTIKELNADLDSFNFNTAIARLMELTNAMYKYDAQEVKDAALLKECAKDLMLLIAPLAPHFAEELWEITGNAFSIFNNSYPQYDENTLKEEEVEIAVQINGKLRARINVPAGIKEDALKEILFRNNQIAAYIQGKAIKKFISVPDKLVNIVV
jgi:leucyl-tRNA synthetase